MPSHTLALSPSLPNPCVQLGWDALFIIIYICSFPFTSIWDHICCSYSESWSMLHFFRNLYWALFMNLSRSYHNHKYMSNRVGSHYWIDHIWNTWLILVVNQIFMCDQSNDLVHSDCSEYWMSAIVWPIARILKGVSMLPLLTWERKKLVHLHYVSCVCVSDRYAAGLVGPILGWDHRC